MKNAFFYQTSIGIIGIAENGCAITNVFFGNTAKPNGYEERETKLLQRAADQLTEYFEGRRQTFALPLFPEGTAFQQAVWQALIEIPYGHTRSYREIALQIGKPAACRAVGRANGSNPISIFIPCHRVVGTNGSLTGYAGGLKAKQFLLQLEQPICSKIEQSLFGLD